MLRGTGLIVGGLLLAGCMQTGSMMSGANFTVRDRAELADPPYQQAWISPTYQRQIVSYYRQDPPGTIVVVAGLPAVVASEGMLQLDRVQLEGRAAVAGDAFLRGRPGLVGARLAPPIDSA